VQALLGEQRMYIRVLLGTYKEGAWISRADYGEVIVVTKCAQIQNKHSLTVRPVGTSTRLTPCNTQGLSTSHIAKHYIYDDFGRVINISFAFGDNTALPRIVGADRIGTIVSPTAKDIGEVFESFCYTFDRNHNIISEHHIVDLEGTEPHDELREYTFSPVGRAIIVLRQETLSASREI